MHVCACECRHGCVYACMMYVSMCVSEREKLRETEKEKRWFVQMQETAMSPGRVGAEQNRYRMRR